VITLGKFTGSFTDEDLARLSVFARQAEIAVKRTKSIEELAASERTYHSLYETTLALADSTDLIRVIEVIANQASIMLGSRKCIFFLVDPVRAVLRPIYSTRQDYQEIFSDFTIPLGEGLSGHVALTGVGIFANAGEPEKAISVHIPGTDTQADERESLISVPMFDGMSVIGVITIGKFDATFSEEDLTKLTVFARQAEIAVKRARNAEELARSEETYKSLYETTLALADETDPLKVIQVIADQAAALARASDCTVYRLDSGRGVLRPIYCNDPTASEEIMAFLIPLGEGISGRVAQTGERVCLNLGETDGVSVHVPGTSQEVDLRESVLSVPMFDAGRVIGVITINKEDDVFSAQDIEKLSIFVRQAEIALLRAENRSALADSLETYHRLYDTTLTLADSTDLSEIISRICDQVTRLLSSIYCTYFTFDASEGVLVPFYSNAPQDREAILGFKVPLGMGLSGKVAQERVGAYSNYTDPDRPVVHVEGTDGEVDERESVISMPVLESDTLLGVITIGTEGKLYDSGDLNKLSIFARLASMAVKRAQNRRELERSEDTYRTLYETTMTLADSTDLEKVLGKIADNARMLMDAHFCNILVFDPEDNMLTPIYTNAPTSRDELMAFRVPLGVGLGGKVAQRGSGAYSNYCDPDRPVVHIEGTDASQEHRESVLGEPIMDGETLLGVFVIHALDRVFTDDDLVKVRVFARLTSVALKRSQYLEALEESEEKYRSLVEQATDGVVIVQDLRFVFVNTAMLAMSGYDSPGMLGKGFFDFIAAEDRPRLKDFYERRMRGEDVPSIYEVTGIHSDGHTVPLELNVGLVQYSGAPADLVIVRDITERKRAEEMLRLSEERYRSIWTKSPIGICLSDRTGDFIMVNPALSQMLGFAEEELVGKRFYDLIAPEEPGQVVELLGETLDTQVYQDKLSIFSGKPSEVTMLKKSGEKIPVEMNIDFITRERSVQYMISLITDITERKKAQEALANYSADLEREVDAKTSELSAARRYLREVIDASPDLVTVVDAEGRLEILNRAASSATGYAEEEVRGKPIQTFYFDRDRDTVAEMSRRRDSGLPAIVRQVDLRTKDGSPITVELSMSPLVDENGRFTGSVAVGRDIRELENLRRALSRSEKLAATGKLAADIAHEVNNPLGIIKNYLQIAKGDLEPASEPYKTIGVVEEEVHRIAVIISGLLDFYRPESAYLEETSVNRLVEDLLMLVGIQLEKQGIAVDKDLARDLPGVVVAPDQLRQVLLNLVTNARDAMPKGGTLTVRTLARDDRVVISFTDSGVGIPAEHLPYIFDPFFTTKGKKGTGLGLSVSYGIVQSFDGMMEAQSAPGEGTTFTISLPARED
jgi:PAS domain S-box-containing protein